MAPSTNTNAGPRPVRSTAMAVPSFDRIFFIARLLLYPDVERARARSTRPRPNWLGYRIDRMHVAILSARTGWHTDELCRALAEHGHAGVVLPYEKLVGRLPGGLSRQPAGLSLQPEGLWSETVPILEADAVLA